MGQGQLYEIVVLKASLHPHADVMSPSWRMNTSKAPVVRNKDVHQPFFCSKPFVLRLVPAARVPFRRFERKHSDQNQPSSCCLSCDLPAVAPASWLVLRSSTLTSTQGYSDLTDGREMISCAQEETPEQFPVLVDLSLTGMVRKVEDNTISPVVSTDSLCHVGRIDLMHDGSSETLQLFDRLDSPVSLFQHVKGIECGGEEVERGECLLEG
mmetsp:Transcript_52429/g.162732  ORF Transcript_52429/g.162732 Transcript_52429/m.162732 type:complete len:211 (-) Transcript_52429:350-982(-)